MRRFISCAVVAATLAVPAVAAADNSGDGSGYGTQPGYSVALANTECAGHGAFGAFGKDNNLSGGANGQLTGYYNSALCGNGNGGTAP